MRKKRARFVFEKAPNKILTPAVCMRERKRQCTKKSADGDEARTIPLKILS